MTDIMIDLETLGTAPGCVILSIGLQLFDPHTGKYGQAMLLYPNLAEQQMYGLRIDAATMLWWGRQKQWAEQATATRISVATCGAKMKPLFGTVRASDGLAWAWGANFDWPVLQAFLRACKLESLEDMGLHYAMQRCARTACGMVNFNRADNPNLHDALADCQNQIDALTAARDKLARALAA